MTIKELLNKAVYKLKDAKIEQPILKARLLMQHTLSKPREYLVVYDKAQVTKLEEKMYMQNIERLISGTPLQHITRVPRIYENELFR